MFTFALWIRLCLQLHWLEIISPSLFWGIRVRLRFRPSFPTPNSVAFLEVAAAVVVSLFFSLSFFVFLHAMPPLFFILFYFTIFRFYKFPFLFVHRFPLFFLPATRLLLFVFPRQCEYSVVNFTHGGGSLLGRSPWRFEGINIFTNWGYGRPRVRNYLYFLCINVPAKLIQNVLHSRVFSLVILLEIALSCRIQRDPTVVLQRTCSATWSY